MRVALVGWDIDDAIAAALAGMGTEVVAFTRWFPDLPVREDCGGWQKLRCPHQVAGNLTTEAWTFRDAVLKGASEARLSPDFDVLHALDPLARPAVMGLREQASASVTIGTVTLGDVVAEHDVAPGFRADGWLCDQPWVAERWAGHAQTGVRVHLIEGRAVSDRTAPAGAVEDGPLVVFWVPREAAIDPGVVIDALAQVREHAAGLSAVVLGSGPVAQALLRRLSTRGWLARRSASPCDPTLAQWQGWIARASVVAVPSSRPASDPTAQAAWRLGKPVVRADGCEASGLAEAIREALYHPGRRERDVRAGAALASQARDPAAIAREWLRVYLNTLAGRRASTGRLEAQPLPELLNGGSGTRLTLTAIAPREVYATWSVRRDDWLTALEWLGPDAARASLALRLQDVTDLRFRGDNAHSTREVELGLAERHRVIALDAPGRSLAASLGVRSPQGYFHALAHASLCHLPREGLAPAPAQERRVRVRRR